MSDRSLPGWACLSTALESVRDFLGRSFLLLVLLWFGSVLQIDGADPVVVLWSRAKPSASGAWAVRHHSAERSWLPGRSSVSIRTPWRPEQTGAWCLCLLPCARRSCRLELSSVGFCDFVLATAACSVLWFLVASSEFLSGIQETSFSTKFHFLCFVICFSKLSCLVKLATAYRRLLIVCL